MPAYAQKVEALGGRGVVFSYVDKPSKFYWRELIEGERRYRTRLIKGATTLDAAIAQCIDAYTALQMEETPARISRQRSGKNYPISITGEIERFLKHEQERVYAGLIKESTLKQKLIVLSKSFTGYLAEYKLREVWQLTPTCLDDYALYRGKQSKLTRQKELTIIKDFITNWLIRGEMLESHITVKKPRIKKSDLDANPAITPHDWRVLNNYIRNVYVKEGEKHPRPSVHYWRVLVWTLTTALKQTGCRPAEMLAMRWRDIEIEDIGRYSKSKEEIEERLISFVTVRASKTGDQREIASNSGSLFRRWAVFQRNYLKEYHPKLQLTKDSLLFGNPGNDLSPYAYCNFTAAWKQIREGVADKLTGNKFSERVYTLYSLRSSFVEDHIAKGTNIYLLARLAGHSIAMLQRHYDRSDIRKFSGEITAIDYGASSKTRRKVIDVFD